MPDQLPIIIKFFRKSSYGVVREYIHRDNSKEKLLLAYITGGKLTLDKHTRQWLEELTQGTIKFQEVIAE